MQLSDERMQELQFSFNPHFSYQPIPFTVEREKINLDKYNWIAVGIHFVNAVVVLSLSATYLSTKPENVVFVSGKMELTYTHYAVVNAIGDKNSCPDVLQSPGYSKVLEGQSKIIDDIMPHHLYDFTNKTVVQFNKSGHVIYTHYMIACFFFLSCGFQAFNGYFVGFSGSFPRVMHYIEYSISSSLMIVVLAVNTGILEVLTLIGLFGLFMGMNILGACAEILSWIEVKMGQPKYWWLLPHTAAWILYLLAYVPVIVQYENGRNCSVAVPDFLTAAIYLELLFFTLFGVAQTSFLWWRSRDPRADVSYWIDLTSITLSIVAKTFLAWILIGPVLSSK